MKQCLSFLFALFCVVQIYAGEISLHSNREYKNNLTTHDALRYVKDNNLTLNNAHTELQKYFGLFYTKTLIETHTISGNAEQSVFNSSFWHFLKAPTDLQNKILAEIGFESPVVQENFRHIPLYYALEWISTCRRKAGEMNQIHLQVRCLLNYEQFYCLKKILDLSARAATNKVLIDNYVAEYKNEQVRSFAFISSEDKKILSSLPDKFMQADGVIATLQDILVAEKPSTMSTAIGTPLSMMLHSVRNTEESLWPHKSRLFLTLWVSLTGTLLYGMNHMRLLNMHAETHNFLMTSSFSMGFNLALPMFIKPINNINRSNNCIVKHPVQLLEWRNASFIIATPLNFLRQYYGKGVEIGSIFAGLAIPLASFMTYDYFKYDRKYAVKTQSIAQLIENHKKDAALRPLCTLL